MVGGTDGRSLEQTPRWAVATVCFVLIVISIFIEQIIHMIGHWFKKKRKKALYESLEKIKAELMVLGFASFLLTAGTTQITKICISEGAAAGWQPCRRVEEIEAWEAGDSRRRLLTWSKMGDTTRRILAGSSSEENTCAEGKVSFMTYDGVNQLDVFISALALFHVIYCVLTMSLGQAKMKKWKRWEKETRTLEYQFSHDQESVRFVRDTSFGRRHINFWSRSPILLWIVCFFRQFVRSVPKVDYLTLRHGFIMTHLAPQSQSRFDFQKYIKRSLEEDFKAVVAHQFGYSPSPSCSLIPMIVLLIGTKLQVIITKMGLSIQERGEVVQGVPVVQPGDDLFWFNRPRLILCLINFVLFQNTFQLAFFAWTWYEFGLKSCFNEHTRDIVIRISMGVLVQILCGYVTLPLYALVTQMGSTMKPTIFNDRVATALRSWHQTAKKQIKRNKKSGQVTSLSSLHEIEISNMDEGNETRDPSLLQVAVIPEAIDDQQHEPTNQEPVGLSLGRNIVRWVLVQILCGYVTLPLYALVTQMGSTMKPTIFNDRVATALRSWHQTAKKQIKRNKKSGQVTSLSSLHEIEISNMDEGNETRDPSLLQVAVIPEAIDDQQHEVTI
ncbi:seven transmembrane MLO family protein [Artemisia annua]|uniref:MLO-like protein n=1 Tax=Artemisia annua TaxID=35608 RepID=A0A2U1PBM1_ARTAN|nr:seven transmembrane MLO family protein [Artemisia annua]